VHLHKPHRSYVSGLEWSDGNGYIGTGTDTAGGGGASGGGGDGGGYGRFLHTASYDGCVYTLDPTAGAFLLHHASDTHEWSAFCLGAPSLPTARLFFLGSNTGAIAAVDPRAPATGGAAARSVILPIAHNKKINTLSAHQGAHLLASASTDASVRVWDVRKMRDALLQIDPPEIAGGGPSPQVSKAKPLLTLPLGASSQSAVWAPVTAATGGPTANALLVTSFDNRLAIYRNLGGGGGGSVDPALVIRHNTQTGRWVVPFRAEWTPAGDGVIVGGMSRTADVYNSAKGSKLASFHSEHLTAIPSRNMAHPRLPVLACGTNSGRVHILR
jgi:WD40 repeat protein